MEWFIIVVIVIISFIPVISRLNKRIFELEIKIDELETYVKKK